MKIIIIEDEAAAVRQLKRILAKTTVSFQILAELDSIESAVDWFQSNALPDLIFLDIHLSDGLSFEIFKHVEITCPIIFTTAYDNYAIQAFKVNSIDYLLKPIREEELNKAISKFQNLHNTPLQSQLTQLLNTFQQPQKSYKTRFLVKKRDQLLPIQTKEIAYFYSEDKITFLQTKDTKYIINYSLDELENLLSPDDFFRLNRKTIASFPAIQKIHKYFNSKLLIELLPPLSEKVIVSRDKATVFKEWLGK